MELQEKIDQVTTRILAAQKERTAAEQSALAHESAAREDRLTIAKLKTELGELEAVLRHSGVQQAVNNAAAQAKKAQEDAADARSQAVEAKIETEATLLRLAEKERAIDELLAKAEAAKVKKE